jgi:hypothetical protein
MSLRRTKLLNIQSVTGIATVGILTIGTTPTAGGVGIASTTYIRSIIMHNTGIASATSSIYIYPGSVSISGAALTQFRLARVDLSSNETYFFETNYPLVLANQDQLVVEVTAPFSAGVGIGSVVNYQVIGDTDI